ncbi:MAG TPA: hypothetical protein DCX07_06090 [Phycisphaerales bacterium]|nr:hypothetical protein [Phycisphaerales bacterium]
MLVVAALAAVCGGGVELKEDEPLVAPPRAGQITGRIVNPDGVLKLLAVSREGGRALRPASFDARSGEFVFRNVPGDATYDLSLDMSDGRKFEGIDLGFADARLLRLAAQRRKQLGLPPERTHRFGMDDVRQLREFVAGMDDFMEVRRVLYVRGHGRRATMLVELMRTREFYDAGGTIIWRVELWYFENNFGGWDRLANQERVLTRLRVPPDQWKRVSVQYLPELSVHLDETGASEPVTFTIPAAGDISRGRLPNTDPAVKTEPHISGLDVPPAPTTQPMTGKEGERAKAEGESEKLKAEN